MRDYLILRCPPIATLRFSTLQLYYPDYDYTLQLHCPTTTMTTRSGRSRRRTTLTIPILPSFLFLPIPHDFFLNPTSSLPLPPARHTLRTLDPLRLLFRQ
jgi:hypothetical protein